MTAERRGPGPCPGHPSEWELRIDPHDRFANGGEAPTDPDALPVPKWRRRGQGTVRAAGDGLGNWNPWLSRFE